jgi:hypothetical protein
VPLHRSKPSTLKFWGWGSLSEVTRRRRDNIFRQVIETAGHEPYVRITQATILAGKERRAHTPHQARHFLNAMRGLFRWRIKRDWSRSIQPLA